MRRRQTTRLPFRMDQKAAFLALLLCFFVAAAVAQSSQRAGHCPLSDSVYKCTPRCMSDFQCSFNEKCCPNKCGGRSCASTSPVRTGGNKYDSGSSVYCEGVKCRPYEKCDYDRSSRRKKCVRG